MLQASHPGPSVVIAAIMTAVAVNPGARTGALVVYAVAALAGQLSIGWSNDVFDADADAVGQRSDKPLVRGDISRRSIGAAAYASLAVSVGAAFVVSPRTGVVNLFMMAAGWAYNAGLKRTLLSGVMFAIGFGLIPVFAATMYPGQPWPRGWAVIAAVLLGLGGHFTNVLADLDADRAAQVRGLPQRVAASRVGAAGVRLIAIALLVAASVILALLGGAPSAPVATVGLVLALGLSAVGLRSHGRGPFIAALAIACVDVVLFVTGRHALV